MKASNALSTLRAVSIALGMIVAFGIPTFGQEASPQNEASTPQPAPAMNEVLRHNIENWVLQGRGVPEDWSTHHLVFSNPGTEEDAIANGTHDRWLNIVNDPRYIIQQLKRSTGVKTLADPEIASLGQAAMTESIKKAKPKKGKLKKDWTQTLIADGQVQPNMYPGKFSFSTTTASCNDFVVYPTGVAGSGTAANIIAYSNLYTGGCTGTVPSVLWAYNTGGMVTTSPIIAEGGSQVAFIQSDGTTATLVLLKWLQPPTGVKGTYLSGSKTITITAGTVTTGDVGMQISGTGIPANDTIFGVVVNAGVTTVTLATATTLAGTNQPLALTAGTVTTPLAPPPVSNAAYRTCTAPCMTTLAFANSKDDTFSAPFYDYLFLPGDDAIYVGDDDGYLHQFTGVFYGTPAESASPWPVQVNATANTMVSSPVYDGTSGYVFVGDSTGVLHAVGTGNAGTTNGNKHGTSSDLGDTIVDGTLVDSTAAKVYAFVTTDSTSPGYNGVYQFPTTFTTGAGSEVEVGAAGTGHYFYSGNFDNVYYSSAGGTAGNLWVVGNTGGTLGGGGGGVNLYRIPIGAGSAMSTPVAAISGLTAGITSDATGSGFSTTPSTTLTWPHTVGNGSNRILLVGASFRADTASTIVTGVTFGGVSLTCLGARNDNATGSCGTAGSSGTYLRSEVWYLLNPTSQTANITVTTNNATNFGGGSASYSGVASVAAGGTNASNNGQPGSSPATLGPVTSPAGNLVFDNVVTARSSAPLTSGNTQLTNVQDTATSGSGHIDGATSHSTATDPTMTWTLNAAGPWAIVGAVLTPEVTLAAAHYGWPSPITEFCNGGTSGCVASGTATTTGTDYLFFSVDRLETATSKCATASGDGCVLAYSINTPTNAPTLVGSAAVTAAGSPGCWSTSAIEPDNSVPSGTLAGASNIYLLELNGNAAGGPTHATYTSSACQNSAANTPSALQAAQTLP